MFLFNLCDIKLKEMYNTKGKLTPVDFFQAKVD